MIKRRPFQVGELLASATASFVVLETEKDEHVLVNQYMPTNAKNQLVHVSELKRKEREPFELGDEIRCHWPDPPHLLENKTYTVVGAQHKGIFSNWDYVEVLSERGEKFTCYASRFHYPEENL